MKCKKTTVIVDNVGRQTIGDINNYIVELEQQCKKQKEVIDKAIEYIEKWQSFQHTNGTTHEELRNLKSILKGSDKE